MKQPTPYQDWAKVDTSSKEKPINIIRDSLLFLCAFVLVFIVVAVASYN